MRRPLLILLALIGLLTACGKNEKALQDLARMNVEYTDLNFVESARNGNADAVKLFLEAGMNTEVKTRDGQTPLMVAALGNHVEVVKLLLAHDANVNAKNKYNGTALMSAAWKGYAEVVDLLLAEESRPRAERRSRHDCADVCRMGQPDGNCEGPLE